jgi:hypothetical protein
VNVKISGRISFDMSCIFNMPPKENNACKFTKIIAFGTRTKRNRKESKLLIAGNKNKNCANVAQIFIGTSSDLIVYDPECLFVLPHLT